MAELTEGLLNSPFFGLGLSAAAWCAGLWVQKKPDGCCATRC